MTGLSIFPASARRSVDPRPNIIRIVVDDAVPLDVNYMMQTKILLRNAGMKFTNHVTPFTICAPSRVSILSGLQAHNHGVLTNDGAYDTFAPQIPSALPAMAQSSGVWVGHTGKYINGFMSGDPQPDGYDDFRGIIGSFERYYDYTLMENGDIISYGEGDANYITDVLDTKVRAQIAMGAASGKPFYIEYWPNACHGPCVPATQDAGTIDPELFPNQNFPSFNVNIINGFKVNPTLTADDITILKNTWALRIETLQAVDRSIARIFADLATLGILENTHVIFTSDNGFQQGEHCLNDGKGVLYEESWRLPMFWRGPGVSIMGNANVISNIDTTAAIAELLGVTGWMRDGRSLTPLLFQTGGSWNTATLGQCRFSAGVRTLYYSYVKWFNHGYIELFDIKNDPYQTTNFADDPRYAAAQAQLDATLTALQGCSESTCSISGNFPPPPHR
jgi:arylsulfatase A-like enzyme